MTIALRRRPLARVVNSIVQAGNGCWLDPSDMTTMFQDAAGTTPVTAVEQPVGLVLDKSQGLMLGPELVSNGTFDAGLTGWTGAAASVVNGELCVTATANYDAATQYSTIGALIVGKTYVLTATNARLGTSGGGFIRAGTGGWQATVNLSTTPKDVKIYFTATTSQFGVQLMQNSVTLGTLYADNISVRELYGYHATQPITASRPTLSARYNLLTKTEYFSDAVWTKSNINITSGQASPFGDIASKIIPTTTSGIHRIYQSITTGTGAKIFTCAIKAAGYATIQLQVTDNVTGDFYADIDLLTGNVTGFIKAPVWVSASITTKFIGDGWILVTATGVNNTNPLTIAIINIKDRSSYAGDGVSGILLCIPDLRLGSVAGQYQRVNTATDYDTDERYFPKYLRFDGVDDYLNLPYMGLYANGSASVVMGISRANAGAVKYAITEGSPAGGKNYIPFRLSDTGVSSRIINDAGTVVVLTPESAGSASSLPEVLSFKDTGNTLTLHKNSSQTNLTNYTRAGSVTLNNLTVGAIVQASVTENMLANLYSLIITKSALTDAQRIKCERYAASKAGVIL